VHWGGPRQSLGSHEQCERIWRNWQNYHMDTHGWVDIAYTTAFCNHGYALAGRGYGTRTAANGTNTGNQNYYAFVWIGGEGNVATPEAVAALEWLIRDARQNGAGTEVRHHGYFTGSACPGPFFRTESARLHNKTITGGGTVTPPPVTPVTPLPEKEEEMNDADRKFVQDTIRAELDRALGGAPIGWTPRGAEERVRGNQGVLNTVWHANSGKRRLVDYLVETFLTTQAILEAIETSKAIDTKELARSIAGQLEIDLDKLAAKIGRAPTAREVVEEHAKVLAEGLK
jgi:hypothetical protein